MRSINNVSFEHFFSCYFLKKHFHHGGFQLVKKSTMKITPGADSSFGELKKHKERQRKFSSLNFVILVFASEFFVEYFSLQPCCAKFYT